MTDLRLPPNATHIGKVRHSYVLPGNARLIVASDRASVFDGKLPTPIPFKGEILTRLSEFWFTGPLAGIVPNHMITTRLTESNLPPEYLSYLDVLQGRSMIVHDAEPFPIEAIVRGYITGSGWKDYLATGEICGHKLPEGLEEAQEFDEPLFTPSTKAEDGHDQNISIDRMCEILVENYGEEDGVDYAEAVERATLDVYDAARWRALECGFVIADSKFEFGLVNGKLTLIDEVITPDSSRFWPLDTYQVGTSPPSLDKQFLRDWAKSVGYTGDPDQVPPVVPDDIVEITSQKYIEAFERITGETFKSIAA